MRINHLESRKGIGFVFLIAITVLAGIAVMSIGHWMISGSGYRQTRLVGMRTNALFLAESAADEAMLHIRQNCNTDGNSVFDAFRSGGDTGFFTVPVPFAEDLADGTGLTVTVTARYRPTPFRTSNGAPGSNVAGVNGPHESCGLLLVRGHVDYSSEKFSGTRGVVVKKWADLRVANTRYSPLTQFSLYLRHAQRQFNRDIPSHASLPNAFNRYEWGFSIIGNGGDVLFGNGKASEGRMYLDMPQGPLADEVGNMVKIRNATRRIIECSSHRYPATMTLNSDEWTAWADFLRKVYMRSGVTLFKASITWEDMLGEEHTDDFDAYNLARSDANFSAGIASGRVEGFQHYYKTLGLIGEYESSETGDSNQSDTFNRHIPYLENKAEKPHRYHVATSIDEARATKSVLPLDLGWGTRKIYGLGTRRAFLYSSVFISRYVLNYKGEEFAWGDSSGSTDHKWYYQYPLYYNGVENAFSDPDERDFVRKSMKVSSAMMEVDMTEANKGGYKLKMEQAPANIALDGNALWKMEKGAGIYTNKQSLVFKTTADATAAEAFRGACVDGTELRLNGITRVYDRVDLGELNITSYKGQGILIANSIIVGNRPFRAAGVEDFIMLVARGTHAMNSGPVTTQNTPTITVGSNPVEAMLVALNGDGYQQTLGSGVRGNGAYIQASSSGASIKGALISSVIAALQGKTKIEYDHARLDGREMEKGVTSVSMAGRCTGWLSSSE